MRSSRFPCPEGVLSVCCRPIDTEPRVQSPRERRPSVISTDRPEMGSRPCEVLLQLGHGVVGQHALAVNHVPHHAFGAPLGHVLALFAHHPVHELDGADGVGVGVRGLGRAVGTVLGGLARHGVAVGIGLGGGIHGHRGILGGIGASGLIVTGGKHRHRKSHHQKDGQQPETGCVLLQKLHKRYLRFPKCVAVYLKKGEDVTQKRPQNRL